MRVSNIGLISKKLNNIDTQFPVQDMLVQTGQLDLFASGIYAFGHIPYLLKQNIDSVIRKHLNKYGCAEISLPILQPENIWIESGRLEKYTSSEVMFTLKTKYGNYCLAPTAEEAVVKFARSRLKSHKQLPITFYQIGLKFRNELRSRGYLLRGKSFDMMDAYSFGRNSDDLNKEYENIKQAYFDIFNELGLNVQPVGADSGDIGGAKSEEFMCLSTIGEDNILFDPISKKAFNSELLERPDHKEYLKEYYGIDDTSSLVMQKAVELGHIFQLDDKYSSTMNGQFVDDCGKNRNYIMGCYGIGVSRTLAMVYENNAVYQNGQFCGVALPVNIAPYKLSIIPKTDDKEKLAFAENVYNELLSRGINVLFDDRKDVSIGAKIKDTRVVGSPFVAVFGNSLNEGYIELEDNKTEQKEQISSTEFVDYFENLLKKF